MATNTGRRNFLVLFVAILAGPSAAGCVSAPESSEAADQEEHSDDQMDDGGNETDVQNESSMDDDSTNSETDRLPEPSPLANPLPGLVEAEDRAAFAEEHDLEYRDDEVKVEIEMEDEDVEPPDQYLAEVVDSFAQLVIAWVAVDDLVDLALHEDVRRVQPTTEPIPDRSD